MVKKPQVWNELHDHFRKIDTQRTQDIKPEEICIVGDRVFTDVLNGNNHGMFTI